MVAHAPQKSDPATGFTPAELGEIAQQRAAAAHLAAVEAGAPDALGLDVHRLFGHARRIAEHVDEQVVTADLAEQLLVVARIAIAPGRTLAEAA